MREHFHPELQAARYVVFVDANRQYTDCSDDVTELVGYDRTQILNMRIDDLSYDKSDVPSLFEKYVREGQQNGEYILRHKNGAGVLIRYNSWVFDDGCHAAVWEPAEEWEQLFFAALTEADPTKVQDTVFIAQHAIHKRQFTIGIGEGAELRQKLRDADQILRKILAWK